MLRDFPLINGESNCTRDREKRVERAEGSAIELKTLRI